MEIERFSLNLKYFQHKQKKISWTHCHHQKAYDTYGNHDNWFFFFFLMPFNLINSISFLFNIFFDYTTILIVLTTPTSNHMFINFSLAKILVLSLLTLSNLKKRWSFHLLILSFSFLAEMFSFFFFFFCI